MATTRRPKRVLEEETPTGQLPAPTIPSRSKSLVFVSHDSRDADLAEAFASLLSDVSAGTLKSFRSSDKKGGTGIEFGAEWYTAIMSQLADATDVVALLTPQSVDRPWILYESGVAKGKLETTVFGVALGVPLEKVSTGPFGQFQNCGDDEDSLTKLVVQLLRRNPEASPREEAVRMQVQLFRQNLEKVLKVKGKKDLHAAPVPDDQNTAKLFEEVKAMVRELPERVDDRVRSASRSGPIRRMRRFNPMMIEELLSGSSRLGVDGGPLGWLIFICLIRDDAPWLYEIGLEFYRAIQSRNESEIMRTRDQLMALFDVTIHSPLGEAIISDEHTFYMLRFLPEMMDGIMHSVAAPPTGRRRSTRQAITSEIKKPKDSNE